MCKGCERREKVKKSIFSGNTLKRGISALLAVCTAAVLFLSPSMGMEAQAAGKGGVTSQACQLIDRQNIWQISVHFRHRMTETSIFIS